MGFTLFDQMVLDHEKEVKAKQEEAKVKDPPKDPADELFKALVNDTPKNVPKKKAEEPKPDDQKRKERKW